MKFRKSNAVSLSDAPDQKKEPTDPGRWRDLTAYWILGLCNNYGYVVMLSAAHDVIKLLDNDSDTDEGNGIDDPNARICNTISTGAILLADILPGLVIKLIAPFLPLWINIRIAICICAASGGFILVALANAQWVAIMGVALTSLGSGLGEVTFLTHSASYHKNVISTWSSGTGGAGIAGSLSYAGLIELGLTPVATLLVMLVVPAIEGVAFWVILRRPDQVIIKKINGVDNRAVDVDAVETSKNDERKIDVYEEEDKPLLTFKDKMKYLPTLLKFIIPLTTVYLFEYFINQGLFELVNFSDIWLDHDQQYRWLQVDYQIGVFISRSSVNIVQFEHVWIMSALQLVNVIYFLFEVFYFFTPSIWIIFAIVLWEGLLGGGAYVNTFYRISKSDDPQSTKQFTIAATTLSDSMGIALAGILAIPTHNAICKLPAPSRG